VTTLTLVSIAVIVAAALSRKYYWVALAVGGGTPIGATLLVAGNAVPTFYAAAIGAVVGLVIRVLRNTRQPDPLPPAGFDGALPLLLFTGWGIVITVVAPVLFFGTVVYLGPNPDSRATIPGTLTTSNVAQIAYLVLSVAVIFFLAGSRSLGPGVIGLAASLVTLLSFWRYLHQSVGLPFPDGLFDNNTTYAFIETLPGGAPRFRGILSEPAGLALSSLVTIAYSLSRAAQLRGARRVGVLMVGAMAAVMAAISTSTTFIVVAIILAVLAGLALLRRLSQESGRPQYLALFGVLAAMVAGVFALPLLIDLVSQVVTEKLGTSSYADRTLTDNRSYEIFVEKFGLGVGLGSNRSSSFTAFLLSTTGLIGAALFVWTVVAIVRPALHAPAVRPVIWALVAVLVSKVISAPDLADPSGILYLCLGVLAWQGVQVRRARRLTLDGAPEIVGVRRAARTRKLEVDPDQEV
jgi:hypothetical protein